MRFRRPKALKDRWDEKAGLPGMRYAPNDRRAQGAKERRPAMQEISTMQASGSEIFAGQQLTIGLDLGVLEQLLRSEWRGRHPSGG